ncbi:hypothetical protein TI05_02030 [Achromatium sp. WMS3]|nr:hypothetical protein TI05_02030 [Achromatium sp. WMS3]
MKLIHYVQILIIILFTSNPYTSPLFAQESHWQSSYRFEALGQYDKALQALDSIKANDPAAELKVLRRGWLYYLMGNYHESIREYRYAKERNANSLDALLGITLPLLAQKRWREAEQNSRHALALAPNNFIGLLRLTMALEGHQDWRRMQKTAVRMVALYPSNYTAYLYLARAYAKLNQRSDAVAAYTAVLMRYPGHKEAKAYISQ